MTQEERETMELVPKLINALRKAESECDRLQAKNEALERAIKTTIPCRFCKLGIHETAHCYVGGWKKCKGNHFELDEARFAGGGENE